MMFGITVLPEWAQAEGIERVLDNLQAAGATAIATSPYVMEPAEEGTGSREPPADGGAGKVRLLDRPLWGKRDLWVRTAPSFEPNRALYEGLAYQPPEPDDLTARDGHIVADFIAAAKRRGMTVHLQVQSVIPPGYRVQFGGPREEDQPLGPDDRPVPGRVDLNASLAAPQILAYAQALARDLAETYPQIDALRIDWPEVPPYAFDAIFFDFSAHAIVVAETMSIDGERMRRDTMALHALLTTGLTDDYLAKIVAEPSAEHWLERLQTALPGVADLFAVKRRMSVELLETWRAALPKEIALIAQAFPPPFTDLSGFDFAAASSVVSEIGVKLYTMHWPMMLRNWGDAMGDNAVDTAALAKALVAITDTGDAPADLSALIYPEPDAPHPATEAAIVRKIETARAATGRDYPIAAFSHGYGPVDDVARRARAAFEAADGRMWMNRYGYLSDEKLAALGAIVKGR
ncbi:hypothetical protein L1787_25115 [Acuticoccus sp. M5D2P5]|uniref:hypothetical protein n=1 Tax=Acuticoccus kalidii TaxID=2910977 RepID=UPI001F4364F7|nr:hypothetical protein [Acuticoccus kalidii]MCF3936676.1 hypothetical protein [Acuticoccus kalidii]